MIVSVNWELEVVIAPHANLIPGGIAPIHASVARDHAVYVEPNVWMEHPV